MTRNIGLLHKGLGYDLIDYDNNCEVLGHFATQREARLRMAYLKEDLALMRSLLSEPTKKVSLRAGTEWRPLGRRR